MVTTSTRARLLVAFAAALAMPAALLAGAAPAPAAPTSTVAPLSDWIGTAQIESAPSVQTPSDGDLWPSCWAKNDTLYTANGDGRGFSADGAFSDIVMNKITGDVSNLKGTRLAAGDQVGQVWSGAGYTRKPTGMVCIGDTIYLAVQDLAFSFNNVPAATILKSTDGGKTWSWNKRKPMFGDSTFTTIWFADHGKGNADAPDRYVYAYGLDGNWRDSFDDSAEDPQEVFLARVPKNAVQDRASWQFYTGEKNAKPQWSSRMKDKAPVLTDTRRLYDHTFNNGDPSFSVISQGGVTWNKGLKRYLYTSWTEYTYEFYESPTPWGPWKRFMSRDFGGYPWTTDNFGGYAATIPSKFISADGRSMYVQSNVCPCAPAGMSNYHFSLRKLTLDPLSGAAGNTPAETNLATAANKAVAISKSDVTGSLKALGDGDASTFVSDSDDEVKSESWWGWTWPKSQRVNRLSFTSGEVTDQGGWFTAKPRVEVKNAAGQWVNASGQLLSRDYPGDASAGAGKTWTIDFSPVQTAGIRLIGFPGGSRTFTSVAELTASYRTQLIDPGFESSTGSSAWGFTGTAGHGVDRGLGFAHSGKNNAWIRTSGTGFSAIHQDVPVTGGKTYTVSTWARTSPGTQGGKLSVSAGSTVLGSTAIPVSNEYTKYTVKVQAPADATTLRVSIGFDGNGTDQWLQIDDVGFEAS